MNATFTLAGLTAHELARAIDDGKTTRADVKAHLEAKATLRPPSRRLLDVLVHTRKGSVTTALNTRDVKAARARDEWIAERKAEAEARKAAKTAEATRGRKPASKPRAQAKPVADDVTKRMDRIEATLAQLIDALTGARK